MIQIFFLRLVFNGHSSVFYRIKFQTCNHNASKQQNAPVRESKHSSHTTDALTYIYLSVCNFFP